MSKIFIASDPAYQRSIPEEKDTVLYVSEFFADTIQGEGINAGIPAIFLRLQGCIFSCRYCDTELVWRSGNAYTINELLDLIDINIIMSLIDNSTHLVLTGGSPLMQQAELEEFLIAFDNRFGFLPYVEIENECIIKPSKGMIDMIQCWNNSPKLEASEIRESIRYKPNILKLLSSLENSWFKFVITTPEDWNEIDISFIQTSLIKKEQVILMPEGDTREHLNNTREMCIALAVKNGVRYSDRLHIVAWNKRTGV